MIKPTLQTVHDALVAGLNDIALSNGSTLTCSNKKLTMETVSEANLPFLLMYTGRATQSEWTSYVTQVSWDIPAELKVKGATGEAPDVLRGIIDDINGYTTWLRGLFVDESGQVHLFSQDTINRYQKGELNPLAIRGGPFLKSWAARPDASENPYAVADLVFHVEFLDDHDITEYGQAQQWGVGIVPVAPDKAYPLGDPEQPWKYQFPIPAYANDTRTQGLFAGPDTTATNGKTNPPFSGSYAAPKGADPRQAVKDINVTPPTSTISHLSTVQLTAVAVQVDGVSYYPPVTWSSSDITKATVSQSGLVTGVAAGTVTITASYGGASGTASVTLT